MNDFTSLDILKPSDVERPVSTGRRVETSALDIHQSAHHAGDVQRLMAKLQHRFSDTADVAYLIESEVNKRTSALVKRANYDSLTHLPNRAYFHDILEDLIQRSKQNEHPFSLLFLDLDGFKLVNDTLGHHIGDELLRHVSGRLVAAVREGDVVSRLGGDEFVILLAELNHRAEIEVICHRIINEVCKPYWFDGQEVHTSTSIGVSTFPEDTTIASELIEKADKALYVSKTSGKHIFSFYEDMQHSSSQNPEQGLDAFVNALAEGRFAIEIEPQIDLKHNRMVGGILSPYWLYKAGEKSGLVDWEPLLTQSGKGLSMATWLLDSACFYAKKWTAIDAEFVVTVPILDALAVRADLTTLLMEKLKQAQLMPNQCQFAFSMAQLEKMDGLSEKLVSLSSEGAQIALTGLGSDGMNLQNLSALSVQEFKFDEVWLQQAMQTPAGKKWVQALIQMANSLDACIIATGVESAKTAGQLKSWGCQLGQGSYWAASEACEHFDMKSGSVV